MPTGFGPDHHLLHAIKRMKGQSRRPVDSSKLYCKHSVLSKKKASDFDMPWNHEHLAEKQHGNYLYISILQHRPTSIPRYSTISSRFATAVSISLSPRRPGVTAMASPHCHHPTPVSLFSVTISNRRGRKIPHSWEPLSLETKPV